MSVRQDVVNLVVNIKGDKAKNELNEQRKIVADLNSKLKSLKKGTDEYAAAHNQLTTAKAKMEDMKKAIGLTALSLKELQAEQRKLTAMRNNATPFSKEYKEYQQALDKVKNRLYEVTNGVEGWRASLHRLKPTLQSVGVLLGSYFGLQALTSGITKAIDLNKKMSDSLSQLKIVLQTTNGQIERISNNLKNIDTRTSLQGLAEIAVIAAKAGVAAADIDKVVAAIDKLQIVSGDELGNVEQTTTSLVKLVNIFSKDGKVTEDAILGIGNSILQLANSGVATGGFIVDFSERLAGVGKSADLSLPAVLGMGAGFEEMGQHSEVAGTAVNQMILRLGKDVPKYAGLAGMSIKDFSALLNSDPIEALITVSEALAKNKGSFQELAESMDKAGADGVRVASTLQVLGTNADFFREKILSSTASLGEQTTFVAAAAEKQENFAGTIAKIAKAFELWLNTPWVVNGLNLIAGLLLALLNNATLLVPAILLLVSATNTLAGAWIKNTLALTANIAKYIVLQTVAAISAAAQRVYALAVVQTTTATTAASAASAGFASALALVMVSLGPLLIIVGAVVGAYTLLSKSIDEANKAARLQAAQNEVNLQLSDKLSASTSNEKEQVKLYTDVLKSSTATEQQKEIAKRKLLEISDAFIDVLNSERIDMIELDKVTNNYIATLDRLARAKAVGDLKAELYKKQIDNETKRENLKKQADKEWSDVFKPEWKAGPSMLSFGLIKGTVHGIKTISGNSSQAKYGKSLDEAIDIKNQKQVVDKMAEESIAKLDVQIEIKTKQLKYFKKEAKEYKELIGQINDLNKEKFAYMGGGSMTSLNAVNNFINRTNTTTPAATAGSGKGQKSRAGKTEAEKEAEAIEREHKDLIADIDKLDSDRRVKDKEGIEKDLQAIEEKYSKLLERARKFKDQELLISRLTALQQKEVEDALSKDFAERSKKEYNQALQDLDEYYAQRRQQINDEYEDGKLTQSQYYQQILELESQQGSERVQIAKDYSQSVKEAKEDEVKFFEEAEKIKTRELRRTIRERQKIEAENASKRAELDIKAAEIYQPDALARLAELKKQKAHTDFGNNSMVRVARKLAGSNEDMTESQLRALGLSNEDIEAYKNAVIERDLQIEEIERETLQKRIDRVKEYADIAINSAQSISNIITNIEERQLRKERAIFDKRKKNLKNQLDHKLISQLQYDKELQKIEDQQDKRQKELAIKQAKRQKALDIFSAVTSTAAAVAGQLAMKPVGPWNIWLAAAMGIAGGLQVAAIASTPLPEMGKGGKLENGPKHADADKGLHVVDPRTGRVEALLERNEGIISSAAMSDRRNYTIQGTASQIASALNAINGGNGWELGARMIKMPAYGSGGVYGAKADNAPVVYDEEMKGLLIKLNDKLDNLKAKVFIKDIDEERRKLDAARRASGAQ